MIAETTLLTLTFVRETEDGGHVIDLNGHELRMIPLWVEDEVVNVALFAHGLAPSLVGELVRAYLLHLDEMWAADADPGDWDIWERWGALTPQSEQERADSVERDDDPDVLFWRSAKESTEGYEPVTVVDVNV